MLFELPSGRRRADLGPLPVSDRDASPSTAFNGYQLFGRYRSQAVGQNAVYYGMGDAWELTAVDLTGRDQRTFRVARQVRHVTAADTATLRELIVAGASPAMRPAYLRALGLASLPRTVPAYSAMLVDPDGHLWIREYDYRNMILNAFLPIPYASVTPARVTWVVLDSQGRWVTDVEVPPTFRVFEIGSDYVLGTIRGADRLERLQVRRLIKQ
jgi:hypothetical protein